MDRLQLIGVLIGIANLVAVLYIGTKLMSQADTIIAGITANNSVISSIQAATKVLAEGHDTLQAEIDELKAKSASGGVLTDADMAKVDAAIAQQKAIIDSLATAIPANTPFQPSANAGA